MYKVYMDGRELREKDALHDFMAREFSFPLYYGRNLDAMHDCLTDLASPYEVEILHPDAMYRAKAVLRLMKDAAEENPNLTVTVLESDDAGWNREPSEEADPPKEDDLPLFE